MIPAQEYKQRRERLMSRFSGDSVIFLNGNAVTERNPDVELEFRQNSHVLYLSPLDFPDVSVLLVPKENKFVLFHPPNTSDYEIWNGKRISPHELKQVYGANEVYSPDRMEEIVSGYKPKTVHSIQGLNGPFAKFSEKDLAQALVEMRSVKSPNEVEEIEDAFAVTANAYNAMMRLTRPGINVLSLQAALEAVYRANECTYFFLPIITNDGSILHTYRNSGILKEGDWLVADSGAELLRSHYGADLTRSWPANGRFTSEQAQIYDLVLGVQKECIGMLKPGVNYKDVHLLAERRIAEGLRNIGILRGNLNDILENGAHSLFFPHGVGHKKDLVAGYNQQNPRSTRLGLKSLRFAQAVQESMVITVEPGIYFVDGLLNNPEVYGPHEEFINLDLARRFRSLVPGTRIEDNVLVTLNGPGVLGTGIPKEMADISQIVGSGGVSLEELLIPIKPQQSSRTVRGS